MGAAIGAMLSSAIGVAISPLPLIALVLMLATPRGRVNGIAFTVGWMVTLAVVGSVMLLIDAGANANADDGPATWVSWVKLGVGVLFALLAGQQWRGRPRPGQPAKTPAWMATLDKVTPGKAVGLAAVLAGANPKNLALTIGAAAAIGGATDETAARIVALILFVVIASVVVLVPLGVYLLGGERAAAILEGWRAWMAQHNAGIMTAVLLVLAANYIGDAISALG